MGVQLVTTISKLDWNEVDFFVCLFSDLNVCAYVLSIYICIRMCVFVCVRETRERGSECSLLTYCSLQ